MCCSCGHAAQKKATCTEYSLCYTWGIHFLSPISGIQTGACSELHENNSIYWKSPAVFQALCKWGNCGGARCPRENVLVLADFCHLALELGCSLYVEKLICPKDNAPLVRKTAVQDYKCKNMAWIAAENYICIEVFKKQYLHYWLVCSYLIPLLRKMC